MVEDLELAEFRSELSGRAACALLEGSVEGAQLGETQQEANFADRHVVARQMTLREIATYRVEQCLVRRAFRCQGSVQGSRAHLQAGGEPRCRRVTATQFVTENTAHTIGDAVRGRYLFEPLGRVTIE